MPLFSTKHENPLSYASGLSFIVISYRDCYVDKEFVFKSGMLAADKY
jgi:hypothetical protein